MQRLLRTVIFASALVMPGFAAIAAPAPVAQFREPEDARSRAVRYACCEDIDIRDAPTQAGTVVGQLDREEQVYVFNLFGPGLPSGLLGCLGTAAPCGTLWAEIYATDQRVAGFVPLNALFLRRAIPQADRLQYEIGFQLIHNGLAAGLQDALVAPPGCGDPSNVVLYRGSDLPGDWVLSPDRRSRQSCNALLDVPPPSPLVPCAEIDSDAVQFAQCRYATEAECRSGASPDRAPSQALNYCQKVVVPQRDTCSTCRDWYALTGQDASGWQTVGELVDGCLARFEELGQCVPKPSAPGGRGIDTPSAGAGLAPVGVDPGGEFDPLDVPGAPEPLVSEPDGPGSLAAAGGTSEAQSPCVGLCQEQLQTWRASSCRGYIGSADRKTLADHEDYECGEIPAGRTHPLYFLNLDTGEMSGNPDPDWKWLRTIRLEGIDENLILRLGRLDQQRSFLGQINDLTRRRQGRFINLPSRLGQDHVWLRLAPISGGRLEVEVCAFIPGVPIDSVPVRPQTTSPLGLLVEEIDLGGVTLDRVELCQPYKLSVNDNYRFVVEPRQRGTVRIEIVPGTLQGVDITYTPLTNGATLAAPIANVLLAALQVTTALAERWTETGNAEFLAEFVLLVYEEDLREDLVKTLQAAVDAGVEQLNDTVDIPELLGNVCGDLAPTVPLSNPTYWFNEFLRWQCEGFAADPNLRAFIPHAASAAQGCYAEDWYINPRDAAQDQWWTPYAGQSWAFNLTGSADRGCRVAGEVSSTLDRDTWPTLICAMAMHNTWLNGPNFPAPAALTAAIQNNCGGFVNLALRAYYGDGSDLQQLYIDANPPTTPGMGGLRME